MKPSIACAVALTAACAAHAQTNVTVYGVLDQGLNKGNGGTATNPGGQGTSKAWALTHATTSRLGFRGSEDLGGGLSAQFQIEHRLNPDTGTLNSGTGVFWNGRSYVQLSSKRLGAVLLGREYTPAYFIQNKSDPFGNDGVGQAGADALWGNYRTPDPSGNGQRASNIVVYKSPGVAGFTAQVAVGLGEGGPAGRVEGANVEYGAGPLYVGVGYEKVSNGSVAPDHGVINLAVHYDLRFVKPILYYGRGETGPNGNVKADTWMLGATAPVGPGVLKAMYFKLDSDVNTSDRSKFGVGYNHLLSKRTNLYADFGRARQTGRTHNTAYAFGVRHTF